MKNGKKVYPTRDAEIHAAYKEHLLNEGNPSNGFEYGARWADRHPSENVVKTVMSVLGYGFREGNSRDESVFVSIMEEIMAAIEESVKEEEAEADCGHFC